MKQKNSFILYKSFYAPISRLSNEILGKLFRAIFLYQIEGKEDVSDDIQMPFDFFVNQFRVDEEKYTEICLKRSESGRKGRESKCKQDEQKKQLLAKDNKCKQVEAQETNASLNDNDNDNVNDMNMIPKGYESFKFDFVEDTLRDVFYKWLEYKRARREKYKTQSSLETAYKHLKEYSHGNVDEAEKIIEKSIGNNYAGFFEEKGLFDREGINTGKIQKEGFEWKQ